MDFRSLEGFVLEKMSETRIPGLSMAIIRDDETVFSRGFGLRDIGSGLPATPRTLYGIGSVTKSFTALAVMQLVEGGKMSLEDPIEKYLPIRLRPLGESVTIHHLLTHSSGIPALGYAEAFIRGVLGIDQSWLPVSSPEDIIAFMRDAESWAVSKPGERFFYLNEGYVLLGHVISKVSGEGYEEYIERRILKPLRMARTTFLKNKVEADPDRATPYIIDKEGKHVPSAFPYGVTADGGLISNAIDLCNYIKMIVGRGEFEGGRIVGGEMLELMEKPYVSLPYQLFGGEAYGYGWAIMPDFYGHKLVGHSGSVHVYTAFIGYAPRERIGIAMLANADGYPLSHLGMYALAQLLGEDPGTLPFVRTDRVMNKLQGTYETYLGTTRIDIKRRGDFLYLETRDKYSEQITPLIPENIEEDKATFYTISKGRRYRVEFNFKDSAIEMIYERYKLMKK